MFFVYFNDQPRDGRTCAAADDDETIPERGRQRIVIGRRRGKEKIPSSNKRRARRVENGGNPIVTRGFEEYYLFFTGHVTPG